MSRAKCSADHRAASAGPCCLAHFAASQYTGRATDCSPEHFAGTGRNLFVISYVRASEGHSQPNHSQPKVCPAHNTGAT
jgi:hypothetical protein